MPEVTMSAALNAALRDALTEDPRVLVYGEDVGRLGGVFRVTDGLQAEFGADRVFDTPIAEAGIVGRGGRSGVRRVERSVVEIQFDGVLVSGARPGRRATSRSIASGRAGASEMPITIRIPSFGGIRGKEHHGESTETYYVHTAGLKVVAPSTALDAYRLLRLAIADPDPVDRARTQGALLVEGGRRAHGRRSRDRRGTRAPGRRTPARSCSYGAMVRRCLDAAGDARGRGHRGPGRRPAIALAARRATLLGRCARETGRVVVVHEAPRTLGMGAEIAALRDGGGVRPPGGAGRARDRVGRAVPAGVARAALPAERRADRRGGPADGELLMAERVFAMPDLGEGLEEGEIVAWLVDAGRRRRAEPAARRGRDREGDRRDPVAVRRRGDDAARGGGRRGPGRFAAGDVRDRAGRAAAPRATRTPSVRSASGTTATPACASSRRSGHRPGDGRRDRAGDGRITAEDVRARGPGRITVET